MQMEVSAKLSVPPELIDVFGEDSENDRTFYGFNDDDLSDPCDKDQDKDESKPEQPPEQRRSRAPGRVQPFRLRVALRSAPPTQRSSEDEDAGKEEEQPQSRRGRKPGKISLAKKEKIVKSEDEGTAATRPSPPKQRGADGDAADSFLAKREQNIKANKAMLAQLMADLQMMPGGAGLLKKQAAKQPKERNTQRPPRSGGEARRNPERASRRRTRSMGVNADESPKEEEEELELSLEEELLEVRGAPRRRAAPRPNKSKPHIIRPVEDITEDEIELVADNMTEKVYNSATGSTCHQCRQKTIDTKTCCRSEDCRGIQGQFCGPCLRNRYGEDVRKALRDPEWRCPPCRGICNCSFCRARDGRCPTGILFPLAQYHGFSDVHSYLTSLRNKLKSENDVEM